MEKQPSIIQHKYFFLTINIIYTITKWKILRKKNTCSLTLMINIQKCIKKKKMNKCEIRWLINKMSNQLKISRKVAICLNGLITMEQWTFPWLSFNEFKWFNYWCIFFVIETILFKLKCFNYSCIVLVP